eukprot:Gb_32988 [translate_table: standard]
MTILIACMKTITSPQVDKLFLIHVWTYFGFPSSVVSDRDGHFLSHFWTHLWEMMDTKLKRIAGVTFNMSSAYHPQIDGQTEIMNKCLEGYLRTYTSDKQGKWTRWLHLAEYWYNTTYHMSAGMSPFKALYGYDPPLIFDIILRESRCPATRDTLQEMQDIIKSLKDNLSMARN